MPRFSTMTDADRGPLGRLLYNGRRAAGLNGRRAAGLNGRRAAGLNGRRAAGLNVDTCADSCGLSRSFLHMVEQGRRAPALAQMLAIADAYQVERREAAWAWILQTAPDVAIYLMS